MIEKNEVKDLSVDLADVQWRSTSGVPETDQRVEVAFVVAENGSTAVAVRDSNAPDGPVLLFTRSEWEAFVDGARKGEFNV